MHPVHARHQARPHRGARRARARHLAARAGGEGIERCQHRPADRPNPVQPADPGRDGSLPRRHQRDGDRVATRNRGHPVGTARHQPGRAIGRRAPLGDPQQADPQVADQGLPRPGGRCQPGRQRARDRRAEVQSGRLPAARRRAPRSHRGGHAAHRTGQRHRSRQGQGAGRSRRRADHHQRLVRTALPRRPHRRPRRVR